LSRCSFIKPGGYRCNATAMKGYDTCYGHRPDLAEERRLHASKGGRTGGRGRSPAGELVGVKAQLQAMADKVLAGDLDRADAAVCGQLLNVKVRVIETERRIKETEEFAQRLGALEQAREAGRWLA
jgi:hypothetical protein